jgi:hypothetical protein
MRAAKPRLRSYAIGSLLRAALLLPVGALIVLPACSGHIGEPKHGPGRGRPESSGGAGASGGGGSGKAGESGRDAATSPGPVGPPTGGPTPPGGTRDAGMPTRPPGRDAGQPSTTDAGKPTTPTGPGTPDSVWSPLSVMPVVNPMDYGATGNGSADDLPAMNSAVNALPAAGGIVFFPSGKSFKKNDLLTITKSHVKLWGINRGAEVFQAVNGQQRHQAILCRNNTGCGVFGLKLRSDATTRFDALEDNQISDDGGSLVEVAGCEVQGSAATGIFLYGSTEHYIEGNYVHHTWADHIHHTNGATTSWVWGNYIFNEAPSKGDDGVACVTYGPNNPRCGDMEWWNNTILHTDWGRGYSVIGGNNISIHDNWAIGVAGAGIIVASESSYDSSASQTITIFNNNVQNCGHAISHPGILVSGLSTDAGPLKDIALDNNVSVGTPAGPYRAEGSYVNVTNADLKSVASALPMPVPTMTNVAYADTSVLRTRDVSHVTANSRPGLYRIHVRQAPTGGGYQQRFEYMVKGPSNTVSAFTRMRASAGDYVSEERTVNGNDYALLLCTAPLALPSGLAAVTFRELRAGDADASLSWLWTRVDKGNY